VGQQPTPPPSGQSIPSDSVSPTTGGWPTPEEAVTRMSNKLNLSEDQKAKITPIIADRQTQMRALMADTSSRRMQKARKAKSIMSDSDKKIEAVLTSDQKKTYAEMKEQMKEQMQARRQQGNNGNMQ
jgi:Spy/CpxP family protein refolding chaperone